MSPALGWTVLALVFLDEVLAVWALGDAGAHTGGWLAAALAAAVALGLWWTFASPKAPLGGPVTRPVVKVLVFGSASAGLWWAGHEALAVALLVFSVVVNGLATLPSVAALAATPDEAARG